jgi:hypothetical protein
MFHKRTNADIYLMGDFHVLIHTECQVLYQSYDI